MHIDEVTERIISGAIAVHRDLGPGLLERTYEICLAAQLALRGLRVERQVRMPLVYLGRRLEGGYRLDLLVEGRVVVEVKRLSRLRAVHTAQMLTYLRLSGCTVGLIINFNVRLLKSGIRRVVLGYGDDLSARSAISPPSAS